MFVRSFGSPILGSLVLLLSMAGPLTAADPATYRGFKLGSSTADVVALSRSTQDDVKKLHQRPAVLEELSWRPPYTVDRNSTARDSVAMIVFSFIDNQLFKMVINYDRSRTEGLTKDDLIDSLSAMYGPRSTAPAATSRRSSIDSLDAPTALARWLQADTSITLQQSPYGGSFGLVILSVQLDALARKAQATAVTLDAVEAPQREAARAKAQAQAERAAADRTRTANKAAFTP